MGLEVHPLYIGAAITTDESFLNKLDDEELCGELFNKAIAEEKIDGNWVSVEVEGNRVIAVRSRYDNDKLHATGWFDKRFPIQSGVFVGEATLGTEAGKGEADANGGNVKFYWFDIAIFDGELILHTASLWSRLALIKQVEPTIVDQSCYDWIRRPKSCSTPGGFRQFYDEIVADGGEGIMVKYVNRLTKPTRADGKIKGWIKIKRQETAEYVVVALDKTKKGGKPTARLGWYDPAARGFINCFQMSVPDLQTADAGRVVEVKGFGIGKSGAMRSAGFLRWRDDKVAKHVVKPQSTIAASKVPTWED